MTLNLDRSGWKRVTLGEVALASKEKVDPTDGSVDRYIAGEHMDTDDLKVHRWGSVGNFELGPAFHRRFRSGQVLYGSRRTYLRKVAVADFDGVCANTTFVVVTKDAGVLLQDFLPFIMTSEPFHAFAIAESKGSVNPYVNWSDIERYKFDLPPLDEQQRISDLLWAVEHNRLAIGDKLAALDAAFDELVDSLLSRPTAAERPLGDALSVCQYGLSTRAGAEGAYPMLRMTNLSSGRVVDQALKYCDLSDRDFASYRLEKQDVLFNRTNSHEYVGHSGIFELSGDFVFASYLIRLRPDFDVLLPAYLNHFVNSRFGQSRIRVHVSKGVQQANISAAKLKTVAIPLPTLAEQRAVIDSVGALDGPRRAIEAEMSAVIKLRGVLYSPIFGGK